MTLRGSLPKKLLLALLILGVLVLALGMLRINTPIETPLPAAWWEFQSIDTMKYSRDPSREKLNDPSFDAVIDNQVRQIAATGATHVAIATPYDQEFLPILKRWVAAARKYQLKVWFRGNWSGWEGWFGYAPISRQDHIAQTKAFIEAHGSLFENGDVFSACPECENGGPGDPRLNGDVTGHRAFLIEEYGVMRDAFRRVDKDVRVNFNSMNGDVARLVMNEATTKALGGVVVIDHFVRTPEQLAGDVVAIAQTSQGRVVLGEFGAPIPDIHGALSSAEQAAWLEEALIQLADIPELLGVNYWVSVGGSTELWDSTGTPKLAVAVITSFFKPKLVTGIVTDELNRPISSATISSPQKTIHPNTRGQFQLPYLDLSGPVVITASGFASQEIQLLSPDQQLHITLVKDQPGLWFKISRFLYPAPQSHGSRSVDQ